LCAGLIVVRAGVGMWVEAYDNLDLLVLLHQGKRTKKKSYEENGEWG
jgi:hypothetical protein